MRIFHAAVAAVDPARLTARHLSELGRSSWLDRGTVLIVGAGKAAAGMAAGCETALSDGKLEGMVIVADGCAVGLEHVRVAVAGHPIPDARGLDATAALCRRLSESRADRVLCLVSGGASSLLVMPRPPVSLADKMEANRLLLASGANIGEVNTVRKHLSLVKGGGLLRARHGRRVDTLILSDVVGDDPSIVGSGPSVADPTTFADAARVLCRRGIAGRVPAAVRQVIDDGCRGAVVETLKPGEPAAAEATATVIGNNALALAAAAAEAERLGYAPTVQPFCLVGDTTVAARDWLDSLTPQPNQRQCFLAGGETTVEVRGGGQGGRNQEFALALAEALDGRNLAILSAGTDGVDGPTDAAGAFVDGTTLMRARAAGLDPAKALHHNDSYAFFERLGDLLRCGPTGTNVMDVKLALSLPSTL